jgi:phenylalanyl-tRNA synthetase alpha subunit
MAEKLTPEEIKKALECCISDENCENCPLYHQKIENACTLTVVEFYKEILALINRQQAEIESKSKVIDQLQIKNECLKTKALIEDKTTATAIMAEYKQHWITTAYINKLEEEIQRLEEEIANYDPFYFCSIAGCEAASFTCWKTCPDSVYNQTRTEAIKDVLDRLDAFFVGVCSSVVEDNLYHSDHILFGYNAEEVDVFIDNLKKEMIGEQK